MQLARPLWLMFHQIETIVLAHPHVTVFTVQTTLTHSCCADAVANDTLVVLNYASVEVAGPDVTLTVNVRRGHCTRQRTCCFTSDGQLVNRSDAIIFNDMQQSHLFPLYRPPHQKWILRTMEVRHLLSLSSP